MQDLSTDGGLLLEHGPSGPISRLAKFISVPLTKGASALSQSALSRASDARKQATLDKYEAIIKKYPEAGIVHIGAHSLGGALSQHLLKSLTPAQERRVRVHTFNALPLAGFDAFKHRGSYFETRNIYDPVSVYAKGPNLRTMDNIKPATSPLSNHAMSQFVGKDLPSEGMGVPYSMMSARGDKADRSRVEKIKKEHQKTLEALREKSRSVRGGG